MIFIGAATCAPSQVDVVGGEEVNLSAAVGTSLQRELNKGLKIALEQHAWPNRSKCMMMHSAQSEFCYQHCAVSYELRSKTKLGGAPGKHGCGPALLAVCAVLCSARGSHAQSVQSS
jgi:hypothetical protein